jgi:hypothetical protein
MDTCISAVLKSPRHLKGDAGEIGHSNGGRLCNRKDMANYPRHRFSMYILVKAKRTP